MEDDPQLTLATLIHGVVSDMLYQSTFHQPHFPELVEMTVIGTGLGVLRSNLVFVKKVVNFWDSTHWQIAPRPFLNVQSLAYANAIAAWSRNEVSPSWINDLNAEVKRPMRRSLKYLFKTDDSFFNPHRAEPILNQPPHAWWTLLEDPSISISSQVIAIRHIESETDLTPQQESLLLEKLGSSNRAITLNAITTAERVSAGQQTTVSHALIAQIRGLIDHRDDEVRAKAMCALTTLSRLDDSAIDAAANMIEEEVRHVVFSAVHALSTVDKVPEYVLPSFDRSFIKALKSCDYEFVKLFATAYRRWLDDPQTHFENLLRTSPEFLPIAMEALDQTPKEVVSIA